ncbi:MAG: peptidylprolyl isomerase [Flavobacteriales bacterium]
MKWKYVRNKLFAFIVLLMAGFLHAQPTLIDKVVAVVGDKPILFSDIENQYLQVVGKDKEDLDFKCELLEELLFQKLLFAQAEKDSVEVNDQQVDAELNKKIRYFVSQIGSVERLEAQLGKSLIELKDEFRDRIKEQLIVQTMQQKIAGDVNVSPAEVKAYYERIPKDSLPLIPSEVQVAHILKKPPINDKEKQRVREELQRIRKDIINGRSFASMAVIYSEDPGSATKGGELGFVNRGELMPEFEAAAFNLQGKEISDIVETVYGFHIIQLIERRGETINCRHILLTPKASSADLEKARVTLDSLYNEIEKGTITFEDAVLKFSDDAETKYNRGLLVNPMSGSTWFEIAQLDQQLFFVIDKMKAGDVSIPALVRVGEKKEAYRLIKLVNRTDPHRANLKDDYSRIQMAAEAEKRDKILGDWIKRKKKNYFIKIDPMFNFCNLEEEWSNKN